MYEWMSGICLIWSRGRLISVDDDRYLNLTSQEPSTGRNLGGNRSVRVILFAHAQVTSNSCSYHIRKNEMNCLGSSEYMTVFVIYLCQFP